MPFDADLLEQLPLNQQPLLGAAVGRTLVDVTRLFYLSLPRFLEYSPELSEQDYFGSNSGPICLEFSDGLFHTLGVWGEALSLVVTPDPMTVTEDAELVSLTTNQTPPALKALLGQTCEDVRVWIFKDSHDEREPKQAGISYLFSGGRELLYCIYLHGQLSNDVLLFDPLPLDRAAACMSIRDGRDILPSLVATSVRTSL